MNGFECSIFTDVDCIRFELTREGRTLTRMNLDSEYMDEITDLAAVGCSKMSWRPMFGGSKKRSRKPEILQEHFKVLGQPPGRIASGDMTYIYLYYKISTLLKLCAQGLVDNSKVKRNQ